MATIPRISRNDVIRTDHFLLTTGASDGTSSTSLYAPCAGARIIRLIATVHTAGTGTGSFVMAVHEATAGTALSQSLTINPDGTADTPQGSVGGVNQASNAVNYEIRNTKTGTVSGAPVLAVQVIWGA